jgi:hypothetical protein
MLAKLANTGGRDESDLNTPVAVPTGRIHVGMISQSDYERYSELWPDLTITYGTVLSEWTIVYIGEDGNDHTLAVQVNSTPTAVDDGNGNVSVDGEFADNGNACE